MKPRTLALTDQVMAALAGGVPITTAEVAKRVGTVPGGRCSPMLLEYGPAREAIVSDVYPLLNRLALTGAVRKVELPGERAVAWLRVTPVEPMPEWAEEGMR